jgi:hypothetical protein
MEPVIVRIDDNQIRELLAKVKREIFYFALWVVAYFAVQRIWHWLFP